MQTRFPHLQGPPVTPADQAAAPPAGRPIAMSNNQRNGLPVGPGMAMNLPVEPIYNKRPPPPFSHQQVNQMSGRSTNYGTPTPATFARPPLVGASPPFSSAASQNQTMPYGNSPAGRMPPSALPGGPPRSPFPGAPAMAPPPPTGGLPSAGYPPQNNVMPHQPSPSMHTPYPPERNVSAEQRPTYLHGSRPPSESSRISSSVETSTVGASPMHPSYMQPAQSAFPRMLHPSQTPSVPPPPPSSVASKMHPPPPTQSTWTGGNQYNAGPPPQTSNYPSYPESLPKATPPPTHSISPRGPSYATLPFSHLSSSGYASSSPVPPPTSAQMMQRPWAPSGEPPMQRSDTTSSHHSQDNRGPSFSTGYVTPGVVPFYGERTSNASIHPPLRPQSQRSTYLEEMMQFNAHSHFVFPSCSKLPNSTRVKEKAHVPVGVVIAPLAPVPDGFPEVPTVNFGTAPLVRCKRCHAYINPFVRWEGNGDRWFCNLCGNMNDTPAYYAKPLDEQGKRVDRMERPELSCGSVEIIASADYMARPPQPPAFMFLIEVSADAVYCGLVEAACSAIKRVLSSGELPGGSRTKVGIITFDSAIQFYNISSELSQPQMLVVPENDVFLPLPDEVMVNAQENLEGLLSLLDQLPNMWAKNTTVETCMGSAVDAAFMAMNHVGGKLSIFISTLPTIGKFALSKNSRSSSKQKTAAAELEMQFLRPSDESYKSIGTDLAQYQISVDIFVCSTQSVDLPTLYPISKFTAGEIHYYPKFQIRLHGDRLGEELLQCFKNILAWEAVMRFRVSRGWRISKWFGHFYIRTGEILIVPNCRAEQTFSILLEMDENVAQENVVYIQAALLYSNSAGERRIRIHTYCLPVIHNFADVSASMDTSVAASLLCQQAIEMALKTSLADARNFLQQQCSQIIAAQGPNPSPKTKLLAMYILGLLKSSAFRESKDVSADMRIYHLMRLECSSLNLQVAYFYPRMISLHNLDTRHGTEDEGRNVILPEAMALSSSGMTEEGVYLLEDGETMLMWIGRGVKSSWLEATFGVISLDYLHPEFAEAHIGSSGDSLGKRIAIILQELRRLRGASFIKMIVLKQGDPLEYKFFMSLIEDQTECMRISLQEFLSKMCQRGVVASTSYRPR